MHNQHKFRGRFNPMFAQAHRAPVSIYKTDTTYELLVFAPGRMKENFQVSVKGDELIIHYKPTIDTSDLDWIQKEYSRGGFERRFVLQTKFDTENIVAKYEDGVLNITLHLIAGAEKEEREIKVA